MTLGDLVALLGVSGTPSQVVATGSGAITLRDGSRAQGVRVDNLTYVTEDMNMDWDIEVVGDIQLGVQVQGLGIVWAAPDETYE